MSGADGDDVGASYWSADVDSSDCVVTLSGVGAGDDDLASWRADSVYVSESDSYGYGWTLFLRWLADYGGYGELCGACGRLNLAGLMLRREGFWVDMVCSAR